MKNNNLILAIDTANMDEAIKIAESAKDQIFTLKIGLEFFNAHGKNGIKKINNIGYNNILLDLKLNDIPQTVYRAIKSLNGIDFEYITVHSLGGKEMIKKAKEAANEVNPKIKILAVTILTSLSDKDLSPLGLKKNISELVLDLAKECSNADGFICSGLEAKNLRNFISKEKIIFSPGIRLDQESTNDQKRVVTPRFALNNGVDKIIMGRSLLTGNLKRNLEKVNNSIL